MGFGWHRGGGGGTPPPPVEFVESMKIVGANHLWLAREGDVTTTGDPAVVTAATDLIADPTARNASDPTNTAWRLGWLANSADFGGRAAFDTLPNGASRYLILPTDMARNITQFAITMPVMLASFSVSKVLLRLSGNTSGVNRIVVQSSVQRRIQVLATPDDAGSMANHSGTINELVANNAHIVHAEFDFLNGILRAYVDNQLSINQTPIWSAATSDTASAIAHLGGANQSETMRAVFPGALVWRNRLPNASQRTFAHDQMATYFGPF